MLERRMAQMLMPLVMIAAMVLAVMAAALMSGGPPLALGLEGHTLPALSGSRLSFGRLTTSKRRELMPRIVAIDRNDGAAAAAPAQQSSGKRGQGNSGPLERITLNLVPRASRALQMVSALTGDSRTDSINRAIQVYAYLEEVGSRGGAVYVREDKDSELQLLKVF
jgi:hypothetical protein